MASQAWLSAQLKNHQIKNFNNSKIIQKQYKNITKWKKQAN